MKEEEAADSSSEQQQQAELTMTEPRSPEARFPRPRDFLGRFLGILCSSFVTLVAPPVATLDEPAGTAVLVPVLALPSELFARSLAFLHRSCVQQAMKVSLLEPFQLEEYFCQEHGSELEPRQDIYDDISVAEDDATETEEANDDAILGSIQPLKKCRDCEMKKFRVERCPACDCFPHEDDMYECCLCDKKACEDCPKSDFETFWCNFCREEYCFDCKSVWICGCGVRYCKDCIEKEEIRVLVCDVCDERACDECNFDQVNPMAVCDGCNGTFCDGCKPWEYCDACDGKFCNDCRKALFCGNRARDMCKPCALKCTYNAIMCDVCTDYFCSECNDFDFCELCDKSACESCADFVQVGVDVRLCTDCANEKIARRRGGTSDQEQANCVEPTVSDFFNKLFIYRGSWKCFHLGHDDNIPLTEWEYNLVAYPAPKFTIFPCDQHGYTQHPRTFQAPRGQNYFTVRDLAQALEEFEVGSHATETGKSGWEKARALFRTGRVFFEGFYDAEGEDGENGFMPFYGS